MDNFDNIEIDDNDYYKEVCNYLFVTKWKSNIELFRTILFDKTKKNAI